MTSIVEDVSCCDGCAGGHGKSDLAVNPFVALRATYGMSLGEDDFSVLMGSPRGKLMLHQAWMHGQGVVWGLVPSVRDRHTGSSNLSQDVWVSPGLAVDGLGRELHSEADQCVPMTTWLDCHRDDTMATECSQTVRGVLVAHFAGCPFRLVPAIADPCDVTRRRNDYSRVAESVRFTVEDTWPEPKPTYRRVRVFLGLARPEAGDDEFLAARADVADAPRAMRPQRMLGYLRAFAARDVLDLEPAEEPDTGSPTLSPTLEEWSGVVLGTVKATLVVGEGCTRLSSLAVTPRPRQALLPTNVLQDLVCALAPGLIGPKGESAGSCGDAGGPRLISEVNWIVPRSEFTFDVSLPLAIGSQERGVEVSSLSDGARGWSREQVEEITLSEDAGTVTVRMNAPVDFETVRIIIRGTGRFPMVGANGVPFAGRKGGPPGSLDDGHDAVITQWSAQRRAAQPQHRHGGTP
jgi:hypothetical protein